jgi:large subunit ribosomal protein L9
MGKRVKIIINQDVLNLGEEGDICEVAPGYARNYLFPNKFAVPYNKHSLTILSQRKKIIEKRKEEKRVQAQGLKEQIQNEAIVFVMPAGDNGKLFGSITNGHIAEELQKKGFALEKKKIEIPDHHIKTIGDFTVKVKLYGNEEAILKVSVKAIEVEKEKKAKKTDKSEKDGETRQRSRRKQEPVETERTEVEKEESLNQEADKEENA